MGSTFLLSALLVAPLLGQTDRTPVELKGRVLHVSGDSVTIGTDSSRQANVGDRVEIYVELPDLDGVAVLATGNVTEVNRNSLRATLDRKTGRVRQNQLARVFSRLTHHPVEPSRPVEPSLPPAVPDDPLTFPTPLPIDDGDSAFRASPSGGGGFADAVRNYQAAMLLVGNPETGSSGTAFVISRKHRLLATNAHVADFATMAVLNESRTSYKIVHKWYHPGVVRVMDDGITRVFSINPADGKVAADCPDLALMQLESVGPDLTAEVELASPADVQSIQGATVGRMGYPGYQRDQAFRPNVFASATFVQGTVSRLTGFSDPHAADVPASQRRLVHYSSHHFPGFSGSPVFLNDGHVVLVHNHAHYGKLGHAEASDLAYGIRVDSLWELLDREGLTDRVNGDPQGLAAATAYVDDARQASGVRNLRAAIHLTRKAADLSRHDEFDRAHDRVEEAIDLAPDYWRPYWQRALITGRHRAHHSPGSNREKINLIRNALSDHQRALKLYKAGHGEPNIRIVLDIARESINLGRLERDTSAYRQAEALLSEDVLNMAGDKTSYVLALRGSLKTFRGDPARGLEDLNEAIRLSPKSKDYYGFRAYIWRQLGNRSAAARDQRRSDELHDREHHTHNH